jgi:hydrogenase nickel incorporation protein HypA/HybF
MEMHEISVCEAIAGTVRQRAEGRAPARVRVRIGYLRQVVPDSLVFNWEMVTAGTDLEGCNLDVDYIPLSWPARPAAPGPPWISRS